MGDGMSWQWIAVFGLVGAAAISLAWSLFKGDGEGGCKGCPKR